MRLCWNSPTTPHAARSQQQRRRDDNRYSAARYFGWLEVHYRDYLLTQYFIVINQRLKIKRCPGMNARNLLKQNKDHHFWEEMRQRRHLNRADLPRPSVLVGLCWKYCCVTILGVLHLSSFGSIRCTWAADTLFICCCWPQWLRRTPLYPKDDICDTWLTLLRAHQ